MRHRCFECDLFALEPGKEVSGVCFREFIPAQEENGPAYRCKKTYDGACLFFVEKGSIDRKKPCLLGKDEG